MIYLSCDPPGDQSKSAINNALAAIASDAKSMIAALDKEAPQIKTAIQEELAETKASFENFADEDLSDDVHDVFDPLAPIGEIPITIDAAAEGLEAFGTMIAAGLKSINGVKTAAKLEEEQTAGNAEISTCDDTVGEYKLTKHAKQRMLERNVEKSSVEDALKNPLKVNQSKLDGLGRPSQRYLGKEIEVVINPETGDIVSVNPTSTSKAMKLGG